MAYNIAFVPASREDLKRLRPVERSAVLDTIEVHLRHEPKKESKSRIKRLRRMKSPQYRLRVDEVRVYYDVHENNVEILAILPKPQAAEWLAGWGVPLDDVEE